MVITRPSCCESSVVRRGKAPCFGSSQVNLWPRFHRGNRNRTGKCNNKRRVSMPFTPIPVQRFCRGPRPYGIIGRENLPPPGSGPSGSHHLRPSGSWQTRLSLTIVGVGTGSSVTTGHRSVARGGHRFEDQRGHRLESQRGYGHENQMGYRHGPRKMRPTGRGWAPIRAGGLSR